MKLADAMQDLSGLSALARGGGKDLTETGPGASSVFTGVLSAIGSDNELNSAAGSTSQPGPEKSPDYPDSGGPETMMRVSIDAQAVDQDLPFKVAVKQATKPQIVIQLQAVTEPTRVSLDLRRADDVSTVVDRKGDVDQPALGLVTMLLNSSGLPNVPVPRGQTAPPSQRPPTFKADAEVAIAPLEPADATSSMTTGGAASRLREEAHASDVQVQHEATSDAPSHELIALLLSGLGMPSASTVQVAAHGRMVNSADRNASAPATNSDSIDGVLPEISAAATNVTAPQSDKAQAASAGKMAAPSLTVVSVSTHLGAAVTLPASAAKPGKIASVLPAIRPAPDRGVAPDQEPAVPPADWDAKKIATDEERSPTPSLTRLEASSAAAWPTSSRTVPTRAPAFVETSPNENGRPVEGPEPPIEPSEESKSAPRMDLDDPAGHPSVKNALHPTDIVASDAPRQRQGLSPIAKVATAVTTLIQQNLSTNATPAIPAALSRTLMLQLDQADLGPVSIQMHLRGQALDLRLTASDHETVALLQREREALTSALGDHSYQLHSLVIQGEGSASANASSHGGAGEAGYGARAGTQDTFHQKDDRNNGQADTEGQRRQNDKPAPSRPLVRNPRRDLFV